MKSGSTEKIGSRISGSPFLSIGVALLIGALVAGGTGAVLYLGKSSENSDLEVRLTEESDLRAEADAERDEAEMRADLITDRRDEIIGDARAEAGRITTKAEAELARTNEKLSRAETRLDSTRGELESVEASLSDAREVKSMSSFPGDGMWQTEVDYLPGTYRSQGGNYCYWATLNSANTSDIADNGLGPGPQIVSIGTPFFETQGCATWERIGD